MAGARRLTEPPPGLCGRCRNALQIVSGKGSHFVLCELSRSDGRFPRYPSLPVIACAGFAPGGSKKPITSDSFDRS